jgi:HlyD family secretion protein
MKYPVAGDKPGGKIGAAVQQGKQSFVWLKKDSMLVHQPVVTGLTDETKVQIVSGVSETDEVVTGYQVTNKQTSSSKGASSPFMPKPPGGNSKKNNQGPPQ